MEDKDKITPKYKDKDKDKNKDKDMDKDKYKDKSKCINENILTKMYIEEEKELIDNNNWTRKKTVKIFWNNNTVSKICEN